MRLTIVVPVYNFAFFIPHLIKSILDQGEIFSQIMVMFVNDGSTDNTEKVIKQYTQKYPKNIFYYNKTNGNWGSVINFVKQNRLIKTEYVTVCDADDWYRKKSFKKIWPYLDGKNDLVITNFLKKKKRICWPTFVYTTWRKKISRDSLKKQTPYCIPLGKFIRTEIFYKLPLLKAKTFYQDAIYTANLINIAETIIYCKTFIGTYFYANPNNSMSRPWDSWRYAAELDVTRLLIDLNCQEIAAIHLLRKKFRRLVSKTKTYFVVHRKFKFKFFALGYRWIFFLIFLILLRKYFKVSIKK